MIPWYQDPLLLALLSAVCFGGTTNFVRKGLEHTDSRTGALVNMVLRTAGFLAAAPWFVHAHYWRSPAIWYFALVGTFQPVIATNLSYAGNQRLGPTITATVNATQPFLAALGAVVFLGERLTLPIGLGTLSIIAGGVAFSWRGRTPQTWARMALLLPLAASTIRAGGSLLMKAGLEILPSAYMGSLVANAVSSVLGVGEHLWSGKRGLRRMDRAAWLWFSLSALSSGTAFLLRAMALARGRVVLVIPITTTAPVFTLLLSVFVFRHERPTRQVLAGVALIVAGVVLIAATR